MTEHGPEESRRRRLRSRAEERLPGAYQDLNELPLGKVRDLVHELEVHQAELEIQNEELRQAQSDLARTRDQYRELFEFAPVGYLLLDADRRVRQANLTLSRMLDVERDTLDGEHAGHIFRPDQQDALHAHLMAVANTDTQQS